MSGEGGIEGMGATRERFHQKTDGKQNAEKAGQGFAEGLEKTFETLDAAGVHVSVRDLLGELSRKPGDPPPPGSTASTLIGGS